MKKTKPILSFFTYILFLHFINAQERINPCRTSSAMRQLYEENSDEYLKFQKFNQFTKNFSKTSYTKFNIDKNIIIPVVFHIYGRTQHGKTITDEKIVNSLQMINDDFQGLNPDFHTVDPLFEPIRSKTNITFKLAQIDPNGNPTTGIVDHDPAAGQGNPNSSVVTNDAWDNKKYMNVYITADLYDEGGTATNDNWKNHSGVAWYPNITDTNNNRARVVYNGRYLKGNADDEFASVLTHEFGHWLNLIHTFEGGCAHYNQDYVDDTPQEDKESSDDGCIVGATDCGDSLINYENYMGYDASDGCAKMFTKGQTDRMYAALYHEARITLWHKDNLTATGVGNSFTITPRVHNGTTWLENTNSLQVCPGTNIRIGMQDTPFDNISILKPNGLADATPDGTTYWSFNNIQESDSGVYLIRYDDGNNNVGFTAILLQVGFKISPWVRRETGKWLSSPILKSCPGTNVTIGMQGSTSGNKSIKLPNGTISSVADDNGLWYFNNIQPSDEGIYTIQYDLGGCTYTKEIELILESVVTPWVQRNNDNWEQQSYLEACIGESIHLGMQNAAGTSNVTLTGPNGFYDTTPDVATGFKINNLTEEHFGTYTITWNDPNSCKGSTDIELRKNVEALNTWTWKSETNWVKRNTIFACSGDNIRLGTNSDGTSGYTLKHPNGTIDNTLNGSTYWNINNVQESDSGIYLIESSKGGCYRKATIKVIIDNPPLNDKIEYQINNQGFTSSASNSVIINKGDKIMLRIPYDSFEGTINWTGPNGFTSSYNIIEISDTASPEIHKGTYTATINHTNNCSLVKDNETINFNIDFNSLSTEDNILENAFIAYPNPVLSTLNIRLNKEIPNYNIEIINISGQIIKKYSSNLFTDKKVQIALNDISNGIYFLKFTDISSKKTSIQKIQKR